MKTPALLAASVLALALSACSPEAETPAAQSAPQTPPMAAVATENLAGFVQAAAMTDMFELQAGRLAVERSRTAAIKDFARAMVADHTATGAQLTAALAGIPNAPTPPAALDQRHADMLQQLRDADPADFDVRYLDQQTAVHEEALALMRRYAENGDNTVVQAFAAETAPKVEHHLDMARGLDRSDADRVTEKQQ